MQLNYKKTSVWGRGRAMVVLDTGLKLRQTGEASNQLHANRYIVWPMQLVAFVSAWSVNKPKLIERLIDIEQDSIASTEQLIVQPLCDAPRPMDDCSSGSNRSLKSHRFGSPLDRLPLPAALSPTFLPADEDGDAAENNKRLSVSIELNISENSVIATRVYWHVWETNAARR